MTSPSEVRSLPPPSQPRSLLPDLVGTTLMTAIDACRISSMVTTSAVVQVLVLPPLGDLGACTPSHRPARPHRARLAAWRGRETCAQAVDRGGFRDPGLHLCLAPEVVQLVMLGSSTARGPWNRRSGDPIPTAWSPAVGTQRRRVTRPDMSQQTATDASRRWRVLAIVRAVSCTIDDDIAALHRVECCRTAAYCGLVVDGQIATSVNIHSDTQSALPIPTAGRLRGRMREHRA